VHGITEEDNPPIERDPMTFLIVVSQIASLKNIMATILSFFSVLMGFN
jgi:hypothetical protein